MAIRHALLGAALGLLVLAPFPPVLAGNLRVDGVQLVFRPGTTGEVRALFDLSWEDAWHNDRNHDAAWVFLKLVRAEGSALHVLLAPDGHRVLGGAPRAALDVAPERTGLFIRAAEPYRGDVRWRLSVAIDPASVPENVRQAPLEVFGVEMVYVPAGPFTLGDPDTTALGFGAFYRAGADGAPEGLYRVASEASIPVGRSAGHLAYRNAQPEYQGDVLGPVPDAFPKGFGAFYVMKYELTQGQYAAFLNTLYEGATFERFSFGGRSYAEKRGTVRLDGRRYVAGSPARPLNWVSWDDGLAFADWAALRPMTELEYTKACRGPEAPRPGEYPWGTASTDALARIVGPGDDLVLTNGWHESRLTDATRDVFGASYYWVMDLAGSVWERVISVGQPDGRAFTGSHGDGRLGERGRATNDDWPHDYAGKKGHGYRGGGFYYQGMPVGEFNPYSPVAYRRFGGWAGAYPSEAYGFRCARSAPPLTAP